MNEMVYLLGRVDPIAFGGATDERFSPKRLQIFMIVDCFSVVTEIQK